MFFSILIPVYNTSKYLSECLESVLSQTETDYEVVLLDDGSTDNSGKICDDYSERYPQIRVIHKHNEGLLMTRRRGYKEAKGEYCICLDSDDFFYSETALEEIKQFIEEKNCDLVIYEYVMGNNKDNNIRRIPLFDYPDRFVFSDKNKETIYHTIMSGKFLNPVWIKAVKKTIIDLDVDYSAWNKTLVRSQGEDLLQSLPLLEKAKRIGYLKRPYYFYRWNSESISRNIRLDYYFAYKTLGQRMDFYGKRWKFSAKDMQTIYEKSFVNILGILSMGLNDKNIDFNKWKNFIKIVSKDDYYINLYHSLNKRQLLSYYKLLGFLLSHNHAYLMCFVIKVTGFISTVKNQKRAKK